MINTRKLITYSILLIGILLIINACRKEDIINEDPAFELSFSADTVIFDTVFTTVGSSTRGLKVYNHNDNKVKITSIRLAGNSQTPYTINVDGAPGNHFKDIEIAGNDSIYIFVRVTVDPGNELNPFIVTDSIVFETNGNLQDVDLVSYGQNAHFYTNTIYQVDDVWENDLPHVIYGYIVVDSSFTLTINPGTHVYLHNSAVFAVANDATLKIHGTLEDPVVIQGDRLEADYSDLPGQWGAIWLSAGSINNEVNYAIIKNGLIGIRVDTVGNSSNPTLRMANTQILNMTGYGLQAQGSEVVATNCVFANCGEAAVLLSIGGSYDFRQCTIGNYWNYTVRQASSLVLNNYYLLINDLGQVTDTIARDLVNAYFGNSIIYGVNKNELFLSRSAQAQFNYNFDHCIIKTEYTSEANNFNNCILNQDPLFVDYNINDYQLDSIISPAVNSGSMEVITGSIQNIQYDILGVDRTTDGEPDMGAYEFIER